MADNKGFKKKHIFFSYDEKDEVDSAAVQNLKYELNYKRVRIYYPREIEDINTIIAQGVENAAVVLVFASPALQSSKNGSKILNYADQIKVPLLTIKHLPEFQPKNWLGAILAAARNSPPDIEEVMNTFALMQINTSELTLEEDEKNQPRQAETPLFHGGTKLGNMTAFYSQDDCEHPVDFEFFGMHNGKVFGQGDDEVGAFTVAGNYEIENGNGIISMDKKYIGKHTVNYNGTIAFEETTYELKGMWSIGDYYSGSFSMTLTPDQKKRVAMENIKNGTKVMLSFSPDQTNLAELVSKKLIDSGIQTTYEVHDIDIMIKLAAKEARVVVPFMSSSYEASHTLKRFLSYADQVGFPIIPIKAQPFPYSQSGWLGVICAGALWTQLTNAEEVDAKINNLIDQMQPYLADAKDERDLDNFTDASGKAIGYYVQYDQKYEMSFDMLALIGGRIAGQGDDDIGSFVINGEYRDDHLLTEGGSPFTFKKHYLGMHDVYYSGVITQSETDFSLDGYWKIDSISDAFHIEVSRTKTGVPKGLHIMLSYQWNNQELVKRVADILKERNIPIWFDIAGDMKGNINAAMADGVEKAAVVLSFNTVAYSKSVNCQKELTYATQLNKVIVPVLLEDQNKFDDTWLGNIISSLNKIDLKNNNQYEATISGLVKSIDTVLKVKCDDTIHDSEVKTIFEGGLVNGYYQQYDEHHEMSFEFFRLSEGKVSGQGSDEIGHFTMAGKYDSEGNIFFKKQYIGQHFVEYIGNVIESGEGFEINGNWKINDMTDKFMLKVGFDKILSIKHNIKFAHCWSRKSKVIAIIIWSCALLCACSVEIYLSDKFTIVYAVIGSVMVLYPVILYQYFNIGVKTEEQEYIKLKQRNKNQIKTPREKEKLIGN